MPAELLVQIRDQVGVVRLNRPDALNALNHRLLQQFGETVQRLDDDPAVRCLLVAGQERAFATGYDVSELAGLTPTEIRARQPFAAIDALDRVRKPVVAAASGYALGSGWELLLARDVVVAAETARFGLPQIQLGMISGAGGTPRLARTLGRAVVMDLVLTARTLTAREALLLGLVSRVVPRENCEAEALAVCGELCRRPPLALQAAKEAVRRSCAAGLEAGLASERDLHALLFATEDLKEGLRAFLEKRLPVFVGR